VSGCGIAMLISLLLAPMSLVNAPGPGEPSDDSTTIELGAALSALDLGSLSGSGYCSYGVRLGYPWRNYVVFEGEYSHYVDRLDDYSHSLFLAGLRGGIRRGKLGAFIKLQPGMIRFVQTPYPHPPPFSKFALAAGGVVEAHLDPHVYLRFDMSYLIIRFGNAGAYRAPQRSGTSRSHLWSIGIGIRH